MDKKMELGELALQMEIVLDDIVRLSGSGALSRRARDLAQALTAVAEDYYDYRQICDYLYDGIHITDGEGKVLFINKAYTRTTGIRLENIQGRKVEDIEREGKLYRGAVTGQVIAEKKRISAVATILGINKEVLVTGTPVFDSKGNVKLVVTNTRDFSELKKLESQLLAITEEQNRAKEELAYLRDRQAVSTQRFYRSDSMQEVSELIHTVADTDVTILITGESGTGKELVANEIYQNSHRKGKPFIKVNCAAIPGELLESELFGYEGGAFTDARKGGKAGMFELANEGVMLLDEIGDMPMSLQTKLLRVLQQRELMRIGGEKLIKLDIRLITATNKDLQAEIRAGRFREDLFYRLNVVPIHLKPLRERVEDIPHLAEAFCQTFNKKYGKNAGLSGESMEILMAYHWPGNIRELENLVERMVVTNTTGTITRTQAYAALNPGGLPFQNQPAGQTLKAQVNAFEREIILHTMQQQGSLRKAAAVLGVDHSTLAKKCKYFRKEADK